MSRILVVEPSRMLQQAMVVALFPEHQIQLFDMIPEAEAIAAADLLIVDAAALRGRDGLPASGIAVLQSCPLPVVWIDAEISPDMASDKTVFRLAPPLKRDDLRAAAAECLRLSPPAPPSGVPEPERPVTAKVKSSDRKPESLASDSKDHKEVIELVEVFEEMPERDESRAEARNKD